VGMNRRKKKRRKEEEELVIAPYTNISVIYYKRRAQDVGSEPLSRVRTYVVTKTRSLCFTVSCPARRNGMLHPTESSRLILSGFHFVLVKSSLSSPPIQRTRFSTLFPSRLPLLRLLPLLSLPLIALFASLSFSFQWMRLHPTHILSFVPTLIKYPLATRHSSLKEDIFPTHLCAEHNTHAR